MDLKKNRGRNYTEKEKMHLLTLIAKYKNVIENKKSDGRIIQKKQEAWLKLSQEFNASSESGNRSIQQLKLLYKNLKKSTNDSVAEEKRSNFLDQKSLGVQVLPAEEEGTDDISNVDWKVLKQQNANDKKELYKTGGGRFAHQLTESGAQVLALLGDRFQPPKNSFDSSAVYHGDLPSTSGVSRQQEIVVSDNDDEPLDEPFCIVAMSPTKALAEIPPPAPASLPRRRKVKKVKMPSNLREIKKEYFSTKLRLARFQLRSAKIQHKLDVKIKQMQLLNKN